MVVGGLLMVCCCDFQKPKQGLKTELLLDW